MTNMFNLSKRMEEQRAKTAQKQAERYEKAVATPTEDRGRFAQAVIDQYEERLGIIEASETVKVVEYKSPSEMQKGIAHMIAEGWKVVGQSAYTPRKSNLRGLIGGENFLNTTPRTTVTFMRG